MVGWGWSEQAVAPALEYCPAGQVKQDVDPVDGSYLPDEQSTQSPSLLDPVRLLYVPASQSSHALFPVSGMYLPAGHWRHSE